jgi:hypothetical protein
MLLWQGNQPILSARSQRQNSMSLPCVLIRVGDLPVHTICSLIGQRSGSLPGALRDVGPAAQALIKKLPSSTTTTAIFVAITYSPADWK